MHRATPVNFPTKYIRFGFISACVQVHQETGENPALTGSLAGERNERGGAASGEYLHLGGRQCAPQTNPVLSPAGSRTRCTLALGRDAAGATACAPSANPRRGKALPTHPPRSWRAEHRPGEGAPPARPAPQQVQPRALPVVSTQTCLPAAGVDPGRSLRRGPGWGTPETGLTPRSWPAGAPAFWGAEPAASQCPEPRRPHAPGASGDHTNAPRPTPHSSPRLRTSTLISGRAAGAELSRGRGVERAAGAERANGRPVCTCSLARPGDSGRPPPGPRGSGVCPALWLPGRVVAS